MIKQSSKSSISVGQSPSSQAQMIEIKGARSNNLKNLDLSIPKFQLLVVTGVSGSGKSSLIIDTLYAEGQRRYVESLSAYARQFLNRMKKPDVDYIKGLCPAIAIQQKVISSNARSTVGSLTEIYDYLRLLFAKVGHTYSPISGKEVKKHEVKDVVDYILGCPEDSRMYLGFPIWSKESNRSLKQEIDFLIQKGFTRIYLKNKLFTLEEALELKEIKNVQVSDSKVKQYYVIVDRWVLKHPTDLEFSKRVADSVQTCFSESHGDCVLIIEGGSTKEFSSRFEADGMVFPEPSAALFNYNNSFGACPVCEGYGRILGIDENKVIPNPNKSVYDGAVACWKDEKWSDWMMPFFKEAHKLEFPVHKPYHQLTAKQKEILWDGFGAYRGIHAYFRELETQSYKIQNRISLARFRGKTSCHHCKGSRLRREALYIQVDGKTFLDLMYCPVDELLDFFQRIKLSPYDRQIADRILTEIKNRLEVLNRIGLSYLHLDRLANTLSGGESQRIHLTRTLGSNLTASLYILDEPSIGLHPKDTGQLVSALQGLRDLGNTVIVIEHEEEVIRQADSILEIGPGAGLHGGQLIYNGPYKQFIERQDLLTSAYLNGKEEIPVPHNRRMPIDFLLLSNAHLHNLQNLEVKIPLQALTGVSGVSGSGKTTLVKHLFYPILRTLIEDAVPDENLVSVTLQGPFKKIKAIELVSQQGIGRSSRSNPATYVKAYDEIRDLFKSQQLSKIRGYSPKHFSFNVEGGRCEACKGEGEIVVEMQFLADVNLLCEDCNGKRFKNEILEVQYKGKNIYEVLQMSIEEALDFFYDQRAIVKKLQPLADIGLSYLQLGQSSSTLSGGEAQRLKLAYYLGLEDHADHVFFIFDEPTTGLHFDDIKKLLKALHALVEKGHSVLVIEHNMDVLKSVDWLIDLGPDGGKHGGKLMYQGLPEGILKVKNSYTAQYLKNKLKSK